MLMQIADSRIRRDLRLVSGIILRRGIECIVQVTNRCNMRCGFCEFWSNPAHPRDELTLLDFEKLASDLAQESSFIISIEGGEPLLRKDIVEIVEIFARKHHPILFTNGWYVTDELAKALFKAGLKQASVSIDFLGQRHSDVRGVQGAFERALAAVQKLKANAPAGGRQVNIISVIMRENLPFLEELLKLSKSLGVGHQMTLLNQKGFRRGEGQVPEAPISKKLLDLQKKYPHFRAFKNYLAGMDDFLFDTDRLPACQAGASSFNVDHLGSVSICIEKINESLGNIQTESWVELRKRLSQANKSLQSKNCQDCWTLCRGLSQTFGSKPLKNLLELARVG